MYSLEDVRSTDPEIAALIEREIARQNDHIELIASENWTSKAVMAAMGALLVCEVLSLQNRPVPSRPSCPS